MGKKKNKPNPTVAAEDVSVPRSFILLSVGKPHENDQIKAYLEKLRSNLTEDTDDPGIAETPVRWLAADDVEHADALLQNTVSGLEKVEAKLLISVCRKSLLPACRNVVIKLPELHAFTLELDNVKAAAKGNARGLEHLEGVVKELRSVLKIRSVSKSVLSAMQRDGPKTAFQDIEALCRQLTTKAILPGSSDLFRVLNNDAFIRRLYHVSDWPEPAKQEKLLRVIIAATGAYELRPLVHQFLLKILDSKLIDTMVDTHVVPILYDVRKRQSPHAEIAEHVAELLYIGMTNLPTKAEAFKPKAAVLLNILQNPAYHTDKFPSAEAKKTFARLQAVLEHQYKPRATTTENRKKAVEFLGSDGPPPEDFRLLSVIPTHDDISVDSADVYLRPLLEVGPYEDAEHYLDVQFRLLREDMVRPLRDGIADFRNGGSQRSVVVYQGVTVKKPDMDKRSGEMLNEVKIKVRKHMRWDKRFMTGSLVCLSSDDFHQDLLFAIVEDRTDTKLAKGIIGMKFENPGELDYDATYCMVESPVYFKAYRHSMKQGDDVPYAKYFVRLDSMVGPPAYLSRLTGRREIDFKYLRKQDDPVRVLADQMNALQIAEAPPAEPLAVAIRATPEPLLGDPLDLDRYLTPTILGMDGSQFEALRYALASELTAIQGPPGTGKTWMGLQLTRLLLDNEHRWQPTKGDKSPILVVCFTNHALDQFLEGISAFCPDGIVRVGGRCKNEKLQKYTLSNLRGDPTKSRRLNGRQIYDTRQDCNRLQKELAETATLLGQTEDDLVDPKALVSDYMDVVHYEVRAGIRSPADLLEWLVGAENACPMNFAKVHALMLRGLPETAAKKTSIGYPEFSLDHIAALWRRYRADIEAQEGWPRLDLKIASWPRMADINALAQEGLEPVVAMQILYCANGKSVATLREEFRASRRQAAQRPPLQAAYAAEAEVEEVVEFDAEVLNLIREENDRATYAEDEAVFEPANWQTVRQGKRRKKQDLRSLDSRLLAFLPYVNDTEPFPESTPVNATSIIDRWRLYRQWVMEARAAHRARTESLQREFLRTVQQLVGLRSLEDLALMKSAKVVGMTTTGAAMHQAALRSLKPRIVIVEEAAEVLEAHLLASLTVACEHFILIGDHQQLRPNPAVYELAKHYHLDVSLFERLINNNFPYRMLKKQHRMRPEISRTLMPFFYEELEDDESVHGRDDVRGMRMNMVFVNHSEPEESVTDTKSHANPYEADYAIRTAVYLMQQGYKPQDVNILCTYLEQLLLLRRLARMFPILEGIRIENVDNYQGEECKIIILSLVRSFNPQGTIGFLKVPNRVCVALSRARDGFYVFGNFDFLASKCELWAAIRSELNEVGALRKGIPVRCQNHGNEQEINEPDDFERLCLEGGCQLACNGRMECGHVCEKPCHAIDADHTETSCTKPCARKCPSEHAHPCKKLCFQECGECEELVEKQLACGHSKIDECHLQADQVTCDEPCKKVLRCGHACRARCARPCEQFPCMEMVPRQLLKCKHTVEMKCHEDPADFKCMERVTTNWPGCEHEIDTICSDDVTKKPCPKPCGANIPGCMHECKGTCGQCRNGRLHLQCTQDCGRPLPCAHICEGKCAKACPPCPKPCETACGHSQCCQAGAVGGQAKPLRKGLDHEDTRKQRGRQCGDACPPCVEDCLIQCQHQKCTRLCYEPCDVDACQEPCMKKLACSPKEEGAESHLCIGMCGEDCPKVCRICDTEKFAEISEIYFGTEDEPDARFVQLKDCGHYVEASNLDKWVRQTVEEIDNATQSREIITITCPKCTTPIRHSKRYLRILNQRAADIEMVKRKKRGNDQATLIGEWKGTKLKLQRAVYDYKDSVEPAARTALLPAEYQALGYVEAVSDAFSSISEKSLTSQWLNTAQNVVLILERLNDLLKDICVADVPRHVNLVALEDMPNLKHVFYEYVNDGDLRKHLLGDFLHLANRLGFARHLQPLPAISDTVLTQLSSECHRLGFMTNLVHWIAKAIFVGEDLQIESTIILRGIFVALNCDQDFSGEHELATRNSMEKLTELHTVPGFTLHELKVLEIRKAVKDVTAWYKCSKGHLYGIGECGGAVQRSSCPDCKEDVGGESHRLVATSARAPEMDASMDTTRLRFLV